ncbi:Outer membrane porin protein [Paraburkholderia graminis C4D1M]|uniref:Porin Gram-negative type n=1 Tax=Paraburkholderia graminis (strain ATCC 700544 / DSM 17151 / LMG 18924 / NCIMB 13744 / C4D1M) TaxID=396598 RepID=B1G6E2_PARG4|nr:porin [Paraburkholderia graminis]EDT08252.1 porin Gram-negative type [Paraburkholderia graminis C4D1M]CAB3723718.1 Outer membrane porin protein [Paraburkholderia graminis C4D1M]
MKKTTIASLIAAGCGCASANVNAQSSITLYGILDVGIEFANQVVQAQRSASAVREQSGNLAGSRWGFKGSEDLGGGYKAVFVLESGFNVNNGALGQGGRLFGRKAFAGISTPYGTVTLGRHQNLLYELMYRYDPLTLNPSYSAQAMDAQLVNRADNSVRYGVQAAGVTFAALYSSGYDSTIPNGANVPGATKVGREMSATLTYDRGPVSAGVTYDQLQGTSIATQSNTQKRAMFGVSYDFRPVTVLAGLRWLNVSNTSSPASSMLYWGGVNYRVTPPLLISAGVYHTQYRNPHGGPTMGILLVDYSLSKRTELYAEGAYVSNASFSTVGIRGAGNDVTPGADQSGVTIGIRHLF